MKHTTLFLILVFIGVVSVKQSAAQDTLPSVEVVAKTYKYLRSVNARDLAQPVRMLEHKAAAFDVRNSEYYEDDNDQYFITFFLPAGYVLAVYDQNGKLLRTAEKYKDVALPMTVRNAVGERFPKWAITKDVYVVQYGDGVGARKEYKLVLENGKKRLRVKIDDQGAFLN